MSHAHRRLGATATGPAMHVHCAGHKLEKGSPITTDKGTRQVGGSGICRRCSQYDECANIMPSGNLENTTLRPEHLRDQFLLSGVRRYRVSDMRTHIRHGRPALISVNALLFPKYISTPAAWDIRAPRDYSGAISREDKKPGAS